MSDLDRLIDLLLELGFSPSVDDNPERAEFESWYDFESEEGEKYRCAIFKRKARIYCGYWGTTWLLMSPSSMGNPDHHRDWQGTFDQIYHKIKKHGLP